MVGLVLQQPMTSDVEATRRARRLRELERMEQNRNREAQAAEDVRAIVAMLVGRYRPKRAYQWGLLTKQGSWGTIAPPPRPYSYA